METSETTTKVYANGRNGLKGRKASPETREKMRLAHLGKIGRKHKPETREKISAANRAKKLAPAHKEKISLAMAGRKHTLERIEKIRLVLKSKPLKGPQHPQAIVCEFRSPTNVVWHVKNITHFVRTHPELFNPEDLIIKKKKSLAISGLLSLTARTRPTGSWKGWTLVSKIENYINKGEDLLGRVLVEDINDITYPGK
jgi:hypothetical protein